MKTFLNKRSWIYYHQLRDGGPILNKYGFAPPEDAKLNPVNEMFFELYREKWLPIKHKAATSQIEKVESIIGFCRYNEGSVNQFHLLKSIINEVNERVTARFVQA